MKDKISFSNSEATVSHPANSDPHPENTSAHPEYRVSLPKNTASYPKYSSKKPDSMHEPASAYAERLKTIEDFYSMPEEWRGELIDGVLYDMSVPTSIHQILAFLIGIQLNNYVDNNNGKCIVTPLPLDTQLDKDDYTMLEPDITVTCNRDKLKKRGILGAPDLVIEILSPSTRLRDMTIKLHKYLHAGVREYWIVNPDKKKISVYIPDAAVSPVVWTFDDSVPVGIWDGKCEIDFRTIYEKIKFLYE